MTNVAQAKKFFHDWLDSTRPWAQPNVNCYEMMEEMVRRAASYFTDERQVSLDDVKKLESDLILVTEKLEEHPDGYVGPCQCAECRRG